ANRILVQDARRDQVKLVSLAIDYDCVTGIGAALISDHYVGILREKIGYFRFSLISKLRPDDNYICQSSSLTMLSVFTDLFSNPAPSGTQAACQPPLQPSREETQRLHESASRSSLSLPPGCLMAAGGHQAHSSRSIGPVFDPK